MNTFTVPIDPEGAIVDLEIGLGAPIVRALRQQGRTVLQPILVRAMIDSGAEVTCVDPASLAPLVAAGLFLQRLVFANMGASGGQVLAAEYRAGLAILHPSRNSSANLTLRNLPILELPLGVLGYQALIGRDIQERCLIVHNGPGRVCTLAY